MGEGGSRGSPLKLRTQQSTQRTQGDDGPSLPPPLWHKFLVLSNASSLGNISSLEGERREEFCRRQKFICAPFSVFFVVNVVESCA